MQNIYKDSILTNWGLCDQAGGASDEYSGAFSVEEMFKLAVGEMNLWLLSR